MSEEEKGQKIYMPPEIRRKENIQDALDMIDKCLLHLHRNEVGIVEAHLKQIKNLLLEIY